MPEIIYTDHGATSFPKAPGVSAAMADYIDHVGVNVNRGSYESACQAEEIVYETRALACRLFHFDAPARTYFTPGHTYALNQVIRGAVRPGDHMIISPLEHNAVMRPVTELQKAGVQVSMLPATTDGTVDPGDLARLIRPNTKLAVMVHASNVTGTILPIAEIGRICKERGVPLCLDAAQTAGHVPIDFAALHLSALCVPGHKGLLGPQGIGIMQLSEEFAKTLSPIVTGGTGSASHSLTQPSYDPDRFESGTPNLPGIYGLNAALKFILQEGVDGLGAHESALTARFLSGLKSLKGFRIVGRASAYGRTGVVSLDFSPKDNAEVADRLSEEFGILTRCGLHCAPCAHQAMDSFPGGTVRFSFGYGNTLPEIDRVLEAIRIICEE